MSETQALTKKEQGQIKKYGDLMDEADVDADDILIPKLLLGQSISKFVKEEKGRSGEIRGSLGMNLIAARDKTVEVICFARYKTWITLKAKGNEFVSQVPLTLANANLPREEIRDGVDVHNYETLNYYCLLPEEVKKGIYMPYVLSFRSTSYKTGKALETHRARLKEFGKPLAFKVFNLGAVEQSNDKGDFYVYTIEEGRDATDEELAATQKWNNIVKAGRAKVDESDLEDSDKGASEKNVTPGKVAEGDEY
jgi:hypothetical protein